MLSPDFERDGWHSPRSVLLFITDDIPFLVDTVRLVLDRHDLGIHLLVHPTLVVERDADGVIASTGDRSLPTPTGIRPTTWHREAWTQIELDRCADRHRATSSSVRWSTAIAEVHLVVDDFVEMQARLLDVADGDPLLVWLAMEHLVMLGVRDLPAHRRRARCSSRARGLGQLPPRGPPRRNDRRSAEPVPATQRVVLARTDAVSTIHRRRPDAVHLGAPARHRSRVPVPRVAGSSAYRESVFAIPVLARPCHRGARTVGCSTCMSHTGRAIKQRGRDTAARPRVRTRRRTSWPSSSSTSSGCRSAASSGCSTSPNPSGH